MINRKTEDLCKLLWTSYLRYSAKINHNDSSKKNYINKKWW
jgi:hypothetical protein